MGSKVILPEKICEDEVIDYLAQRYHASPVQIITSFFEQEGIIHTAENKAHIKFKLMPNEMEILRDMGLRPTTIEFICQPDIQQ